MATVETTDNLEGTPPARPSVSVILPAYNEELILGESLERLHAYMQTLSPRYRWELVIVDDGSTDGTAAIADGFAASHRATRVLHHRSNFQLGQALRYAFGTCSGDYVVTLDADLSYSPDHVGSLLETIIATRAKIVIASPYAPGGRLENVPATRALVSRAANRFLSFAVHGQLSTLTGMVRAYDRLFLSGLNLKAMDIEINTEILYKARVLRARIVEIPATLNWGPPLPDPDAVEEERRKLRVSSIRVGRSTAAYVFNGFLFRPALLFVLPGTLILGACVVFLSYSGYLVLDNQKLGPHIGWFLAGGVSLIVGIQLIIVGLLCIQAKRYFEELFHLGTAILRTTKGDARIDRAQHATWDN